MSGCSPAPRTEFGRVDLVDLTTSVVRTWRANLLAAEVGEAKVAAAYRLLRAIMTTAVEEDELVRRNSCRINGADTRPRAPAPAHAHTLSPGCSAVSGRR